MKSLFLAITMLAMPAFAQEDSQTSTPVVSVFTAVQALPANGGINPDYAGVRLKGTIRAGGNPCQAQAFTASVRQEVIDGVSTFTPVLEVNGKSAPIMCPMIFDENFKGLTFDQTFIVESVSIPTAIVRHVLEADRNVALTELYKTDLDTCEPKIRYCTKEFNPHICSVDGITVKANNKCEAFGGLRVAVCRQELAVFDAEAVVCTSALK